MQDDFGFKVEYVYLYVDGVDDFCNCMFCVSCFNSWKLSVVFIGGFGVEEVLFVWVDCVGFKVNLMEVCFYFLFYYCV